MKLILESPTLSDEDMDIMEADALLDQGAPGGTTSLGTLRFTRDEWTRFCAFLGGNRRSDYRDFPVAFIPVEVQDEQGRQAI